MEGCDKIPTGRGFEARSQGGDGSHAVSHDCGHQRVDDLGLASSDETVEGYTTLVLVVQRSNVGCIMYGCFGWYDSLLEI